MSATYRDTPIFGLKRGRIYEVGHSMDIHNNVDELSQKLDWLLQVGHTSTPSTHVQDVCAICSSPTYSVGDCLAAHQFSEFMQ